jgi:hypothetical protein
MGQRYRSLLVSAIVASSAVVGLLDRPAAAAHSSRWQLLGDGSLQIRFAPVWTMAKDVHFESEWYTLSAGRKKLLLVYLGNNPDLNSISHDAIRSHSLNGSGAREYYSHGVLTDIVVTPKCGHDKYVWMSKMARRPQADVDAAMRSLRCGTTPRS